VTSSSVSIALANTRKIDVELPPLKVMRPAPCTMVFVDTDFTAVRTMACGADPQLNVIVPPLVDWTMAKTVSKAIRLQLAGVPVPTTPFAACAAVSGGSNKATASTHCHLAIVLPMVALLSQCAF
jgi:hypothetical protein